MIEHASDKTRVYEQAPAAPAWVHTIEVSHANAPAHFVTVWVCAGRPLVAERMAALVAADPSIDVHDPSTYHADDEAYRWVDLRFPRKEQRHWRYHYHWRFDHEPTEHDVSLVLGQLGEGAVSPVLLRDLAETFNQGR